MSYLCETLFSHPGRLLEDHLLNVGQTAQNWINDLHLEFELDKRILAEIACIIGLAHDLGKSTKSFQKYLFTENEEEKMKMKNHEETRHSPLGAFCGFYLVQEYLRLNRVESEYLYYLPLLAFFTIQRHHGDLYSVIDETSKGKKERIRNYIHDVDEEEFDNLLGNILDTLPGLLHCNYKWFKERTDNYEREMRDIRDFARKIGRKEKLDYYFLTNLLYSTLIDADKSDASGLKVDCTNNCISGNLVDEYRNIKGHNKPGTEMNILRNEIYQEAINFIDAIETGKHILSINVPTGTGKTLAALSASIKLKDCLKSKDGIDRSIIYALPFTSIIDQNHEVFNEVFEKVTGIEPGNDILLKHHYLADGFYRVHENEEEYLEYSPLDSRFIIEGWNSSIIVTTFVQFFHSIITNRNSASRKLHRITNSIIILDEVQAIPHKYWYLLRKICNFMAAKMDTYFIFVTATLPLIFPSEDISELVPNKEDYYEALNRITLEINTDNIIDISEFQEIVLHEALNNKDKDILIVLNTIKSAQIVYEFLIKELDNEENSFYYLSSHVVPYERRKRIEEIKRNDGKRKIVVSTQLIEAGVDIDMDIVFRDMGPLDSINQVAGRCNRNTVKGKGIVKIYYIKRGKKPDSSYIYDSTLLNATSKIINDYSIQGFIEEKDFFNMSNSYYKLLNQGIIADNESENILQAVCSLNYKKIQEFRLIEENYEKADLFIEIDEEAQDVWNKYLALSDIADRWQRREKFYRFKNKFQQYTISVQKQAKWLQPFADSMVGGIFHIDLDIVDTYYKREESGGTGFVTEGDSYAIW